MTLLSRIKMTKGNFKKLREYQAMGAMISNGEVEIDTIVAVSLSYPIPGVRL